MLSPEGERKEKSKVKASRMPFGISSRTKDQPDNKSDEKEELDGEKEDVKIKNPKKIKTKEEHKKPKESSIHKVESKEHVPSKRGKPVKGKIPSEPYSLWLRIEDFDPIPFEVDPSITLHEMKQRIHDDSEFELQSAKMHKMKCFSGDGKCLDPRLSIAEQLDDEQEVWLRLMGPPVIEAKETPRRITPPTPTAGRPGSQNMSLQEKNSLISLQKRLDEMDQQLAKKNEAFDESVKHLADLADRLKRMNGIPAVGNELRPALGGIPGLKSKDMIGHDGPVWTLSNGNEHLFSGSSDTTIKVWDINTLRLKHTLRGHTSIVHCVVAFNKDKTVVSGSDDRTIKIWDVQTQTCKATIPDDNIACVLRVHRGHLFSGSFKYVKVWNLSTHSLAGVLPGHNHWVRAITLANGYCYSGGHNVIKVWDMANFNCVRTMNQPCGSIYSVLVHGNMLYAGTYENTVNIWDLRSYEFVRSLPGHTGAVYALALHGNKLFSGSYDNTIRVWDLATFKCVQRLTGHSSSVEALATSSEKLFSASTDNIIKCWKFPSEEN